MFNKKLVPTHVFQRSIEYIAIAGSLYTTARSETERFDDRKNNRNTAGVDNCYTEYTETLYSLFNFSGSSTFANQNVIESMNIFFKTIVLRKIIQKYNTHRNRN
jgi:hypothetical protein